MSVLITGGAGFIGANFVLDWVANSDEKIVNLDKLTYAGNRANLASLAGDPRHRFVQGDIGDRATVDAAVKGCDYVFHVAAKAGVWGPYE